VAVLAGAAVAAVVAASGALAPSHPVPNLVGDSTARAAAVLRPLHLKLAVASRSYASRPAGLILGQRPVGGRLEEGDAVAVSVSLGPRPIPVPTLARLSLPAATQVLHALNLKAVARYQTSMTDAAGTVISSDPDKGTLLPGQPVTVVVSTGKPKVHVPKLTGVSVAAADRALSAIGLSSREVVQYSDSFASGVVIGTQPAANTLATVGSTVTMLVSKGPHLATVPTVQGLSVGAASLRLSNLGFQVSGVSGNPIATVSGSSPAAGVTVHYGASVQLITG
jgi:serine/threonine-protein kinase